MLVVKLLGGVHMGINSCWCRGWGGPLYLLAALVVLPGCGQQVSDPIPNGASPPDAALAPVAPVVPTPAALAERFLDDAPQQPLCGDALLGADFSLDDSGLPTVYVDAATETLAQDGSAVAPFRRLSSALFVDDDAPSSSEPTLAPQRRVLVAGGFYDEDVAVPPGTLLLGGYDAETWEQGAEPSVISGSVYLGTATAPAGIVSPEGYLVQDTITNPLPSTAPLSALRHFTVDGGVEVVAGARALLRDNVIAPVFFSTNGDAPDMRRAIAVWIRVATVRADHNRLVVPADDPASIVSSGFFTWESCAWITENEIADYRSPIYFHEGLDAAATFNVIRRAQNGVGAGGNQALIAGNSIHTLMPSPGCVYAIHLHTDAHPDIRDNTIYLTDEGNRGILEEDGVSHPTALLGNRFYSPQSSPALYVDHRGAVDPQLITTIGALNAIPGIPAIGGNTFARAVAMP
ncbi:MAG TPA: hypothetical protein VHP33_07810 [Polyangiaceae bacterium]|nr:hypothetical protein [Polyangiaceae bacterium]